MYSVATIHFSPFTGEWFTSSFTFVFCSKRSHFVHSHIHVAITGLLTYQGGLNVRFQQSAKGSLPWPTNRTGENRTGEPRPLDWTLFVGTSVDAFVGRFVGPFVGVLEGLKTGKSTLVGPVVGALVGDLVCALVGPLVGPFVVPLVDPLVGRGSLSPALCVAHSWRQPTLAC